MHAVEHIYRPSLMIAAECMVIQFDLCYIYCRAFLMHASCTVYRLACYKALSQLNACCRVVSHLIDACCMHIPNAEPAWWMNAANLWWANFKHAKWVAALYALQHCGSLLCCIEQSVSLHVHLNWVCIMRAHVWATQYGVDGGWLKNLLYFEKEGILVLIACLASV